MPKRFQCQGMTEDEQRAAPIMDKNISKMQKFKEAIMRRLLKCFISCLINQWIDVHTFLYRYETSDGTSRKESAVVNNLGSENEELAVTGEISWVAPDGQVISFKYIADKNGFQPIGDHIPN